jgi:hypothetical protein
MKFVTLVPFTFWVYLALLVVAGVSFGVPGIVVATVIMMVLV